MAMLKVLNVNTTIVEMFISYIKQYKNTHFLIKHFNVCLTLMSVITAMFFVPANILTHERSLSIIEMLHYISYE